LKNEETIIMQKITPFLWFDGNAEEAMNFYVSTFENSKVGNVTRYGDSGPLPKGTVMTASFELFGHSFMILNGGGSTKHPFTPAISFMIDCETQDEVDRYWEKLTAGGKEQPCGWLVDRFGVSWQVIPRDLPRLLSDPDPNKAGRVVRAMLEMKKIDLKTLERAAAG
jgi:predicted 3-demethylubiquinone-9 3-methyltransferase (glyoxalase superfamily)